MTDRARRSCLTERARRSRIESCILRYERVWGRASYAGSRLFTVQAAIGAELKVRCLGSLKALDARFAGLSSLLAAARTLLAEPRNRQLAVFAEARLNVKGPACRLKATIPSWYQGDPLKGTLLNPTSVSLRKGPC